MRDLATLQVSSTGVGSVGHRPEPSRQFAEAVLLVVAHLLGGFLVSPGYCPESDISEDSVTDLLYRASVEFGSGSGLRSLR